MSRIGIGLPVVPEDPVVRDDEFETQFRPKERTWKLEKHAQVKPGRAPESSRVYQHEQSASSSN